MKNYPKIELQKIPGLLKLIMPTHEDERGQLVEAFDELTFPDTAFSIKKINYVISSKHTLRGLHYQVRYPQAKLLQLAYGNVFDVCVDLRVDSPTFGKWQGFHLQFENELLFIPHGIAHGFYAMETSTLIYYMDNPYRPKYERSLLWNDSMLSIKWPLVSKEPPIMSQKDRVAEPWEDAEKFYLHPPIGCMWTQLPLIET